MNASTSKFEERKQRAVEKAKAARTKAEERLAVALDKYEREVEVHEARGDGFFSASYIFARREAVLARKYYESKRSALVTAEAEATAARLGEL